MPVTYITRFKVSGSGEFPADMLRYDGCYPNTECPSLGTMEDGPRDVTLTSIHAGPDPHLTPGRWASFCWRLDPDSIRTEKF